MSKRIATYQLTDLNCEQEDEPEEAGVFKTADEDTIKKREIKTAKRRAPTEAGSTAFKGFAGFGAKTTSSPAAPAFSFGTKGLPGLGASSNGDKPVAGLFGFSAATKKDTSPTTGKTESEASKDSKPAAADFKFTSDSSKETTTTAPSGFKFTSSSLSGAGSTGSTATSGFTFGASKSPEKKDTKPLSSPIAFGRPSIKATESTESNKPDTSPKKNGNSSSGNPKYLAQLKGLNEAVTKWIKNHVDENPYILLTPIFKDYEKYLEKLEKENPEKDADGEKSSASATKVSSGFSFGTSSTLKTSSSDTTKKDDSTAKSSPFTFGSTTSSTSLTSGFSFNSTGTTSATSGFSFKPSDSSSGGTAAPFSFATGATGATSAPAAAGGDKEAGDEEYVPPKPESVEIKEDDAIYTKRCKMFFQKDGAWTERGVGNLYLKPLNDKTQLLIRADNTLGTVLLNIVLSSGIPTKRQGKNNVSLICTPNPPLDPKAETSDGKPASLLLRVKTSEDADELLAQLDKHKS